MPTGVYLHKPRENKPLVDRFWGKVDKSAGPEGCWLWTGHTIPRGYGIFAIKKEKRYAHRTAYELCVGPIPHGMLVCHHCDIPACCNPSHLFIGTCQDNARDMAAKGRGAFQAHPESILRGENAPRHKLTKLQVIEIRSHYAQGNITISALAKAYKVTHSSMSAIIRYESWRFDEE